MGSIFGSAFMPTQIKAEINHPHHGESVAEWRLDSFESILTSAVVGGVDSQA
ncbi:hypothetical protein [Sphingomonas gilva]|uniref:hypothetical protein n=1 Tax=Sphingomonas gilva TaxID=2305907 RepID=UPI001CA39BB7|nr:hypothetical protein [Sphingomonas gilva]